MATLEYLVEYVLPEPLPCEGSAFIHLKLDLPTYLSATSKEDYFSSVAVDVATDEVAPTNGGSTTQTFTFDNSPVYTGTITGTLFQQLGGSPVPGTDTQVQTFTSSWVGNLTFVDIGNPSVKASSGTFNVNTSRVMIVFNTTPVSTYYLQVTYTYATETGGSDAFLTGLFNLPGVTEAAVHANRVWVMKSPAYEWNEVLANVVDWLRISLDQDEVEELDGSGAVINSFDQRRPI